MVRKNNKLLLLKREDSGAIANRWELPGGKVRYNEPYEEAVIREWDEELGITVKVGDFLCSATFTNKDTDYTLRAYEVLLPHENFDFKVHTESMWVTLQEALELNLAPSDKKIIEQLK